MTHWISFHAEQSNNNVQLNMACFCAKQLGAVCKTSNSTARFLTIHWACIFCDFSSVWSAWDSKCNENKSLFLFLVTYSGLEITIEQAPDTLSGQTWFCSDIGIFGRTNLIHLNYIAAGFKKHQNLKILNVENNRNALSLRCVIELLNGGWAGVCW